MVSFVIFLDLSCSEETFMLGIKVHEVACVVRRVIVLQLEVVAVGIDMGVPSDALPDPLG
tara:strand:+ start:8130 stop:8309 length:180 start_codon:yes stop_codon:yes gene_type:complete